MAESKQSSELEVRPWVQRLGSYLRIFGKPSPGTMGYLTSPDYIDHLIERAKEREASNQEGRDDG